MNVEQIYRSLEHKGNAIVRFRLPSGQWIPEHFHVTEVGRIDKHFIDCGGTRRRSVSCLLQTWTADDVEHRLNADKLVKILMLALPVLETFDLPVDVEFGVDVAAQYSVIDVDESPGTITFVLEGKQTDCLARDKCGVGECGGGNCC